MKLNWHVSIRTIRELLNRNNISNQISLFNVSKNDLFTGLMRYYVCCKFLNDFLFRNEMAIPQQEFMFLKFEKVHLESCFEVRRNYSKIFGFPNISQSMHIFFFQVNSCREVFLENIVPENICFLFQMLFFPAVFL